MTETIHKAYGLEKDFFIGRNFDFQRTDLSFEAQGLLAYLLSLPSNWKIIMTNLERDSAGREKIRRMVHELVEAGYMALVKDQDEKGKFVGSHYEVFAIPEQNPHRETGFTTVGKTESRQTRAYKKKEEEKKENTSSGDAKITDADKLAQALSILPASKQDWALFGKLARELKAAGIDPEAFPAYVEWVKKQAKAQGNWTVTPNSLTANARPSLFIGPEAPKISLKKKPASYGFIPETRSEEELKGKGNA